MGHEIGQLALLLFIPYGKIEKIPKGANQESDD